MWLKKKFQYVVLINLPWQSEKQEFLIFPDGKREGEGKNVEGQWSLLVLLLSEFPLKQQHDIPNIRPTTPPK